MQSRIPRYINPYTDFGFKKLFGEEGNKDLLIDFLNQILPEKHQIQELSFRNPENIGELPFLRKAVFDIYCRGANDENFIVEMQKEKLEYFKDRSLFAVTFPIQEQAKKGDWNFRLQHIYLVAILDFKYDEKQEIKKFQRYVQLKDQDGDVFYEKLHFKFLQMPLFNKTEFELETRFDKWCFFLKNLESFDHIPAILKEPIFEKAFHTSEIGAMSRSEYDVYMESLMGYWESKGMLETAMAEGIEKGKEVGREEERIKNRLEKIEIARKLLALGTPVDDICRITGLDKEDFL